jgi:primosomal protein N' (replication factor Y)
MPSEFVQVILPLSLHETYTYRIPEEYKGKINTGQRVIVQFGRKKLFSALVLSVEDSAPLNIKVKEILQIVDEEPVVLQVNIDMWKWMAEYYCCSLGDVYRAAFPPGLILESKSKVFLTGHDKEYSLTDKEYLIIDHAGPGSVSLDKLQQKLGKQFSYKAFSSLLVKGLIGVDENIEPKFKTKKSSFIKLNPEIKNEEQLNEIIQKLSRSKKQLSLLLRFCEETLPFDEGEGAFIL